MFQGNIEFEGEDQSEISNEDEQKIVSSLLSVTQENLEKALCSRVIAAGGQVVDKQLNVPEANYARTAFVKVIVLYLPATTWTLNFVKTNNFFYHIHNYKIFWSKYSSVWLAYII